MLKLNLYITRSKIMDKYQLYLSGLLTEAQYNASIEKKEEKLGIDLDHDKEKGESKKHKNKIKEAKVKREKIEKKEKLSKKELDKKLGESFEKPSSISFKEWITLKEK